MNNPQKMASDLSRVASDLLSEIRLAHGRVLGRALSCDPHTKYPSHDSAIRDLTRDLEVYSCHFCKKHHLRPSMNEVAFRRAVELLKTEGKW